LPHIEIDFCVCQSLLQACDPIRSGSLGLWQREDLVGAAEIPERVLGFVELILDLKLLLRKVIQARQSLVNLAVPDKILLDQVGQNGSNDLPIGMLKQDPDDVSIPERQSPSTDQHRGSFQVNVPAELRQNPLRTHHLGNAPG
jgi:hypothetical protein